MRLPSCLLALAALSLLGTSSGPARATVVERVVAVVGERPILLSELKRRAAPLLRTLGPTGQSHSKLYSELLDRLIDEELVQRSAARSQLKVTEEEVDQALQRVAKGNNVEVGELLAEVERSGVSPTDYKRELRNQLLDAKVMNLRLQGRIRVSEEELKREYDQLAQQERQALPVSLRVVRLAPSSGAAAPPRTAAQLKMLAKTLVEQARSGADFAELSRQHSSDEATRTAGGQLAPVSPSELPRELAQQVVSMNPGDVSAPIETGGLIVVLKLEQRTPSALPPFSDVLPQLEQRVQLKKMEAARRTWLDALRKTTHVEVRL